jgi:hypothetical protein
MKDRPSLTSVDFGCFNVLLLINIVLPFSFQPSLGWSVITSIFIGFAMVTFAFRTEGWIFSIQKLKGTRRVLEIILLTLNVVFWHVFLELRRIGNAAIKI